MPLYGYARVSTVDQDLAIQEAALRAAGCQAGQTHEISPINAQRGRADQVREEAGRAVSPARASLSLAEGPAWADSLRQTEADTGLGRLLPSRDR